MQCTSPVLILQPYKHPLMKGLNQKKYPHGIEVPCGRCIACRINKAQEWAIRILHELRYWDKSCFVTLTYNKENNHDELSKRESQLFIKRLRKQVQKKIKYFLCGEYGGEKGRPHYHCILLGINGSNHAIDRYNIILSGPIKDCWTFGNIYIGDVTFASARYVAGYVSDKLSYGVSAPLIQDKQKPFHLYSQGLGLSYVRDQSDKLRTQLGVTIYGNPHPLPRYYKKKLNISTEQMKDLKEKKDFRTMKIWADRGAVNMDQVNYNIDLARKTVNMELQKRFEQMLLNQERSL